MRGSDPLFVCSGLALVIYDNGRDYATLAVCPSVCVYVIKVVGIDLSKIFRVEKEDIWDNPDHWITFPVIVVR